MQTGFLPVTGLRDVTCRVRPIRTSDVGNIGAKLNTEKLVPSVCWYQGWKKCESLQHSFYVNYA